jgi:hypothetical protein
MQTSNKDVLVLYSCIRTRYWFWGVVEQMRLLVLVVIEVFGRWVRNLSTCLSACLPACLVVSRSACLPACLSVCPPACLSVCLSASACVSVCLSVYLPTPYLCLHRSLAPFIQLHLFISIFLLSVMVSLVLKPYKFAATLDAFALSAFALILFLSLVRSVRGRGPAAFSEL